MKTFKRIYIAAVVIIASIFLLHLCKIALEPKEKRLVARFTAMNGLSTEFSVDSFHESKQFSYLSVQLTDSGLLKINRRYRFHGAFQLNEKLAGHIPIPGFKIKPQRLYHFEEIGMYSYVILELNDVDRTLIMWQLYDT